MLGVVGFKFPQTRHNNFTLSILQNLESIAFIQQILDTTPVYFKETNEDHRIIQVWTIAIGKQMENIFSNHGFNTIHSMCLSTTSLSICKYRSPSTFTAACIFNERQRRMLINILSCRFFTETIIETERRMIEIFRNPIYFQLCIVHPYNWMITSDRIVIFDLAFLFAHGSLSHCNADLWLLLVRFQRQFVVCMFIPPLFHESNEIDITRITRCQVPLLFFCPFYFTLLHETSAFFSLGFHVLNAHPGLVFCSCRDSSVVFR
mmetsp:Transcript_27593/g.40872  ORF Transcript_27593/g.40872 Transcript_27593/m.40872 type:complete len:262 (+) Transcript_27593:2134-2919(+)